MSRVPFLVMKESYLPGNFPSWLSGRRVNMGGQMHVWLRCARAWQPPAVSSEALRRVFSANLQVAFTPLQTSAWRLARQRAAQNLEAAFSGSCTDTCYELHFFCLQFRGSTEPSLSFATLHVFSGLPIASIMPWLLVCQVLCLA